jgi:hypothetical protein
MAPEELRRRAIARALANGGASAVRRVRLGLYKVESATRPGTVHTVAVDVRGTYHCTCEAALAGRPACWHRASVWLAKLERTSPVRVTGPGTRAVPVYPAAPPANIVAFRPRAA